MISNSPTPSRVRMVPADPDAAFREDVLQLLTRLDLEPAQAIALVEAVTGRPFESCGRMHLVPLLQQLLELVHAHLTPVDTGQSWHV